MAAHHNSAGLVLAGCAVGRTVDSILVNLGCSILLSSIMPYFHVSYIRDAVGPRTQDHGGLKKSVQKV
jgi:hypothetical protein